MKTESTIEFWKRLCSTPTGLKAVQKSLSDQHLAAHALKTVQAQSAAALLASKVAAAGGRPSTESVWAKSLADKPLFGLARTAAAWNAQLAKSAPRPSTASVWAKQFPANEPTGLARTLAAFKRAA